MRTKHFYEFQLQLMVNGEYLKKLQTIRIIAEHYESAEFKLKENFKNHTNVKLIDIYFINGYTALE